MEFWNAYIPADAFCAGGPYTIEKFLSKREIEILTSKKVSIDFGSNIIKEGVLKLTNHRIFLSSQSDVIFLSLSLITNTQIISSLFSKVKLRIDYRSKNFQSPFHPRKNIGGINEDMLLAPWSCQICCSINSSAVISCTQCGMFNCDAFSSKLVLKCDICSQQTAIDSDRCSICGSPFLFKNSFCVINFSDDKKWIELFAKKLEEFVAQENWKYLESDFRAISSEKGAGNIGIATILRTLDDRNISDSKLLSEGLEDVNRLSASAKVVSRLVNDLQSSIAKNSGELDKQLENQFQLMLSELGMLSTSTSVNSKMQSDFFAEVTFFVESYMVKKAILLAPLTEIYCTFNKIKGSNMISPGDFMLVIDSMSKMSSKIVFKKYGPSFYFCTADPVSRKPNIELKILSMADIGMGALVISKELQLSLSVSAALLESMNRSGDLCIDSHNFLQLYYPNNILKV